jgi:NHL repeat
MSTGFSLSFGSSYLRTVNTLGIISTLSLTSTDSVWQSHGGLDQTYNLATDAAGNLYVADGFACVIYKVSPSMQATRIAGNGTENSSGDGGLATNAEFIFPRNIALDAAGNVYVADASAAVIRAINMQATTQTLLNVSIAPGCIETVAGNGNFGSSGNGSAATSAEIEATYGICLDPSGNLYLVDNENSYVRWVNHSTGIINAIAGTGSNGFSGDGGNAAFAQVNQPTGVTCDSAGNVYIVDKSNNRIRVVNRQGTTQTLFGVSVPSGDIQTIAGSATRGYAGDNGPATSAELNFPYYVSIDSSGNLYITDQINYRIRLVNSSGTITTIAGNGTSGDTGDGGAATSAKIGSVYTPVAFFTLPTISSVVAETQIDAYPSAALGNSFVRFRLRLPPTGITVPQAAGTPITVTATMASGSISQNLIPNSAINVPGNFYTIETWSNGRITSSINAYLNADIDLSNVTPLTNVV